MATQVAMIKLMCSDDTIDVKKDIAMKFSVIANIMEDLKDMGDIPIPVPNVNKKTLEKIIEFCEYHNANQQIDIKKYRRDNINEWDAFDRETYQKMDIVGDLIDFMNGIEYLGNSMIYRMTCVYIAYLVNDKSAEEIKKMFGDNSSSGSEPMKTD